jgi:hypothetical protein
VDIHCIIETVTPVDPQVMASELLKVALMVQKDPLEMCPFACQAPYHRPGGKPDDTTILVSVVSREGEDDTK